MRVDGVRLIEGSQDRREGSQLSHATIESGIDKESRYDPKRIESLAARTKERRRD